MTHGRWVKGGEHWEGEQQLGGTTGRKQKSID
jgi:hypothetical protein